MELLLKAPDVPTALHDLQTKGLIDRLRSVGSSEVRPQALCRWIPSGVETFTPLTEAVLVAELADPDGRVLELVYNRGDSTTLEVPGLLAIEIQTRYPDAVAEFYSQLGFVCTLRGLIAASGQRLLIEEGEQREWVRIVLVVDHQRYVRLKEFSRGLGGIVSLLDPNGYELRVIPEGGIIS